MKCVRGVSLLILLTPRAYAAALSGDSAEGSACRGGEREVREVRRSQEGIAEEAASQALLPSLQTSWRTRQARELSAVPSTRRKTPSKTPSIQSETVERFAQR